MNEDNFIKHVSGLINTMTKTNEAIRNLALEEAEYTNNLMNINQMIEKIEFKCMEEIRSHVDENGKPLHKNETERKIALSKRVEQDTDYRHLITQKREIGQKYGETKTRKEYYLRQFSIWKLMLGMRT